MLSRCRDRFFQPATVIQQASLPRPIRLSRQAVGALITLYAAITTLAGTFGVIFFLTQSSFFDKFGFHLDPKQPANHTLANTFAYFFAILVTFFGIGAILIPNTFWVLTGRGQQNISATNRRRPVSHFIHWPLNFFMAIVSVVTVLNIGMGGFTGVLSIANSDPNNAGTSQRNIAWAVMVGMLIDYASLYYRLVLQNTERLLHPSRIRCTRWLPLKVYLMLAADFGFAGYEFYVVKKFLDLHMIHDKLVATGIDVDAFTTTAEVISFISLVISTQMTTGMAIWDYITMHERSHTQQISGDRFRCGRHIALGINLVIATYMAFMGGMGMRQFLSNHASAVGFVGAIIFAILAAPGRWADYFMLYGPYVKDTLAGNPYRQFQQAAVAHHGFVLLEEINVDDDSTSAASSIVDYGDYVETTDSGDSDSSEIDYGNYVTPAAQMGGV